MSEFHEQMEREAAGITPSSDALIAIRGRANRNRRLRRVTSGAIAFILGGASVGLAWTAFDRDPSTKPRIVPSPPPHRSRENPVLVRVVNRTELRVPFVVDVSSKLSSAGLTGHKGYEIRSGPHLRSVDYTPNTTIYSDPAYEAVAIRVKNQVLPTAEIRIQELHEDVVLRVVVGQDYIDSAPDLAPFVTLDRFMKARFASRRADPFLSEEALQIYQEGKNGLSLYAYTEGEGGYELKSYRANSRYLSAVVDITMLEFGLITEKIDIRKGYPAGQTGGATTQVVVFARRIR